MIPGATLLHAMIRGAVFYVLLFGLGVASLGWNLMAAVLFPLLPRGLGQRWGRAAISRIYRSFWWTAQATGLLRIDAGALESLQREPGGLIIAANHPSMLDALLIVAFVPRGVCIMKAALMNNVFLGAGARLARYIRNDTALGMVRGAVTCLREGGQLVVFPEGTRTVQAPINRFMPGVTLIAHLAQTPIQTVLIETDSPYLSKGWPIWRLPRFPVDFRLQLGERFMPQADHAQLLEQLQSYVARELRR